MTLTWSVGFEPRCLWVACADGSGLRLDGGSGQILAKTRNEIQIRSLRSHVDGSVGEGQRRWRDKEETNDAVDDNDNVIKATGNN